MGAARVRSIANLGPKIGAYFEAYTKCYREFLRSRTGNFLVMFYLTNHTLDVAFLYSQTNRSDSHDYGEETSTLRW